MSWVVRTVLILGAITITVMGGRMPIVLAQETGSSSDDKEMNRPSQNATKLDLPTPQSASTAAIKNHWSEQVLEDFAGDQKALWTSPKNIRLSDAQWIVPFAGVTAAFIATDADYSHHLSQSPAKMSHYGNYSNASLAALVGGAGALWALSYKNHNSHWRETGFLAGEAALNSFTITEVAKYSFGRARPIAGHGSGRFFQGGVSFPSEHATAAWAIAGVIAHEYPGPLTKILAYGAAGLVSYSRIRSRQHFPADVFVGGVLGNLVAQNIYSRHHDTELGGEDWQSASQFLREHWNPAPESAGTPYIPLDNWVYSAIDRLASMGLVHSEFLTIRPWTRLEGANLTAEASGNLEETTADTSAEDLVSALRTEFAAEFHAYEAGTENTARLESLYSRFTQISGTPLTDGYHFGQTITNDNGRPYQQGFNNISGFSAYATAGRFAIYVSGEYQHAPNAPGYSSAVQEVISNIDHNPVQPVEPIAAINQFSLENAYLSTNIESWNLSFGRQNIWWGPDYGSSFLYSDNAAPLYMVRLNRVTPFYLPWFFRLLGPAKLDLFVGRPQGHEFPARPLIHGEMISFKPTQNLELAFSRTVVFGGVGRAMTPQAIWNSYFSFTSSFNYGPSNNPGKRNGGFDFSYKLPFLRNWVTVYADSMTPDDPSPLDAPRRAAINPGLHFTKIPGFSKLDLRVEGIYTDITKSVTAAGQYIYWESFYHDLYTNDKNIIGSWIGREGEGVQAWTNYWFSPKSNLELGYRHQKVASDFVPGGETLNDGSVNLKLWFHKDWNFTVSLQYEQWKAPVLSDQLQKNWTSSFEVRYWPHSLTK